VRHGIAIVAGSSGLEYGTFALFAYAGALLWTGIFISAGYYLGEQWRAFPEAMTNAALWILATTLTGVLVYWGVRAYRRRRG
jgi:undecaprenyl-diphosphatase